MGGGRYRTIFIEYKLQTENQFDEASCELNTNQLEMRLMLNDIQFNKKATKIN